MKKSSNSVAMTEEQLLKLKENYLKSLDSVKEITEETEQYYVDEVRDEIINAGITAVYSIVGVNIKAIKTRLGKMRVAVDPMVNGTVATAIDAVMGRVKGETVLYRYGVERIAKYINDVSMYVGAVAVFFKDRYSPANINLLLNTKVGIDAIVLQITELLNVIPANDFFNSHRIYGDDDLKS